MKYALCFTCGELKLSAICSCPSCYAKPLTDYMLLGIFFSDHHFSADTLREFGKIISHFRSKTGDDELVFWCFIHLMGGIYPNKFRHVIPDDFIDRVKAIYNEIELPKLELHSMSKL